MSTYSLPLRAVLLATPCRLSALYAVPAQAFADDEARRAILEMREQIKQITEQNSQARLQLADQLETMQPEIAEHARPNGKAHWQTDIDKRASQDQSSGTAAPKLRTRRNKPRYDDPMGLFRSGKYKEPAAASPILFKPTPAARWRRRPRFYRGSSLYASKDFKDSVQGLQDLVQGQPGRSRAA